MSSDRASDHQELYIIIFKKAQVDNGRELNLIENVLFLSPKQFPLAMVKSYMYNNKNI
jgi:hypothetical protein